MKTFQFLGLCGLSLFSTLSLFFTPVHAEEFAGFKSPTGNIFCMIFEGNLRCDLLQNEAKLPPHPKDCDLDWGNAFGVGQSNQKAERVCAGDSVANPRYPILNYGKSISKEGFTCRSERTGMTCKNKFGRGFFLSRQKQTLF